MNTDNNINVEINPISEDTKFRLSYKRLGESKHKSWVLECSNDNGETYQDMQMFRGDTNIVKVASFGSPLKARRFLKKILLANNKEENKIEEILTPMFD